MQRFRSLFVSFCAALTLSVVWISPAFAADAPEVTKIVSFIQTLTNILLAIAAALAALFLVVGGITYISSTSNPQKLDGAKQTIFNAGIGLVVCLGAVVITNLVSSAATSAFGK